MGNILDRHDPAKAIPQLEKMLKSLEKGQAALKGEVDGIEIPEANELYRVDIYATRGNLIQSVVASTELEARLYSWDTDITETADASWFNWSRVSGDATADAEWNASHGNGKKIITVYEQDVGEQSTFLCTVNDNNTMFTEAQIVVSCNLSLQENISDAIDTAIQTAESIVNDKLDGYTTAEDLEAYKQLIQSQLIKADEGYAFEFQSFRQTLEDLNGEIELQKSYIRLIEGKIYIGKNDSPITTVYTENGLEIRYGDEVVAKYTNEVLEVTNVSTKNQTSFWGEWAIRKGTHITDKGNNLNIVWIGG